MKPKRVFIFLVFALAIVIAGILISKSSSKPATETSKNEQQNNSSNQNPQPTPTPSSASANEISGTLKTSNNKPLGNLMIVSGTQTVYIHTSRDYSSLLGKQVTAQIDGTLTNFTLIDIKPQ